MSTDEHTLVSTINRQDKQIDEMRAALKFIASIAEEELSYSRIGTGAEVALRHIARRARQNLKD